VPATDFLAAVDGDTRLACLMLANNEVGTLQPVAEVAAGCRQRGVPVLTDAVQAVGKVPVDALELGVSYLSMGAHKLNGPVGAAALWLAPDAPFEPYLVGGSHERQRRASTQNVLALVGLGAAARMVRETLAERIERFRALRDRFEAGLARIPDVTVHCRDVPRLPQTSHVAFHGVEGEALLIRLDLAGYAVSTGSACSSGVVEPSPTLLSMGMEPREALASLRVSFGQGNTAEHVDAFLDTLEREVATLRDLSTPPVRAVRAAS
jgi:cysteine desulfurase